MSDVIQRPESPEARDQLVAEQYERVGQDRDLTFQELLEDMKGQIGGTGKIMIIRPMPPARLASDQPQQSTANIQNRGVRTQITKRKRRRKELREVPEQFILKTDFGEMLIKPSPSAYAKIKASGRQLFRLPVLLTAQTVSQLRELQTRANTALAKFNLERLDYVPGGTADSIRATVRKYPGVNLWSVEQWAHQVLQGETSLFDPNSAAPADSGNIFAMAWLALEQYAREEAVVNDVLRLFLDAVTALEVVAHLHPDWGPLYEARSAARIALDQAKAKPEASAELAGLEPQYTTASQACYPASKPHF